ncbi:MAG TPA: hypothetical protein VIL49_13615, partial [Capillimicrobium sp.]
MLTLRPHLRTALAAAVVALCALAGAPGASAAAPVTTASETWVGEVVNEERICCKAASTLPVRAAIRVQRVDGSGGRTLLECARGQYARLVLRGSVAVWTADCPDRPGGQIMAVDLDAGEAPRIVATAPGSLSGLKMSASHVAYATFVNGGGRLVDVVDLATGAPVRSVALEPGVALSGVLDDGTLAVVGGGAFECAAEVALIAPDGSRTEVDRACDWPVAVGMRMVYVRAAAEPGVREVVLHEASGETRVLGALRPSPTGTDSALAFDGRRAAWTEDRCSDGVRTFAVEVDAGAPPLAAGPAHCPWSADPRATVTPAGRLALTVRCPLGCADLFHVTARRRTVALRRAVVAPGEQVLELRMGRWARRALRREGRLD